MGKFTERLWQDLDEHGATLAQAEPAEASKGIVERLRRPRILAGSTLSLAGVGAAAVLVLGGASAGPAFAVTTNADGAVVLTINQQNALPEANAKLATMGLDEAVGIFDSSGPADTSGPVTCTDQNGASGKPVQVILGTDGTEVIPSGNTGAGTWHLAGCVVTPAGSTAHVTPPAGYQVQRVVATFNPGPAQGGAAKTGSGTAGVVTVMAAGGVASTSGAGTATTTAPTVTVSGNS